MGYEDDGIAPDRVDCKPGRDTVKLARLKIVQRNVHVDRERAGPPLAGDRRRALALPGGIPGQR